MQAAKVNVLILEPYLYDTAPSQRFRWEQWARLYKGQDLAISFLNFETEKLLELRRQRKWLVLLVPYILRYFVYVATLIGRAFASDVVVVHRNATLGGPPIPEALLFLLRRKVVYDFDDAIFLPPPVDNSTLRRILRCDWRVGFICKHAKLVIAGNEFLAQFARKHYSNVVIHPSTIDANRSKPVEGDSPPLTIGWTGSPSTIHYLEAILPQIADLQKSQAFDFLVVGGETNLASFGIAGRCEPWSTETEIALLQSMDIGLMPLTDSLWERGKCAFKAIQYQSVGIPAVVSDVGMNRVAVLDGKTGVVLPVDADWKAPLAKLLEDETLRKQQGRAARSHIEENYAGQSVGPAVFADIQRHCMSGQQGNAH